MTEGSGDKDSATEQQSVSGRQTETHISCYAARLEDDQTNMCGKTDGLAAFL